MALSSLSLLLDVHVVLERLWVFLGAVLECSLLGLHLLVLDVWVICLTIVLYVKVACTSELKWLSVPGTYVKMIVPIFMRFTAYAGFE